MDKKRERSINFTVREREVLIELALKFNETIERKKNDSATWREKGDAWRKLAAEFNSFPWGTGHRSGKSLKSKYECIKKELRKKLLKHRKSPLNTRLSLTEIEKKVKSIILLSADGLPSNYYSNHCSQIQPDDNEDNGWSLSPQHSLLQTCPFLPEANEEDDHVEFKVEPDTSENIPKTIAANEELPHFPKAPPGLGKTITPPQLLMVTPTVYSTPTPPLIRKETIDKYKVNNKTAQYTNKRNVLMNLKIKQRKAQIEREARRDRILIEEEKQAIFKTQFLKLQLEEKKRDLGLNYSFSLEP